MTVHAHPRTGVPFESPVPPGTGWPGDPAGTDTPAAADAGQVAALAATAGDLASLDALISVCRACPRLVTWREEVAVTKRRSFAGEPYWGRPITGWGSARPKILVLGLAPAAHGGNRTGRVFTGDRSGDQLFAALHRAGLVNSAISVDAADGLRTNNIRVAAAVRCAPPGNAPTPDERSTCEPWLAAEWRLIAPYVRVIVTLGGFGWQAALRLLADELPGPAKPKFGHGVVVELSSGRQLMSCYHPSQQNMFTGRLTPDMLDAVLADAVKRAGLRG
ncbi:uracil-DNA glycosylase [Mycobacterium sp. CVI_P3]|uniref:Type-5 uracil-DNA glycosylase n=1 Tax=Mycobacterium pinniadriaticum TaxID=2994102 RepID=A0ABT3SCK3_9MYCO|nr:uracil-DNA glycosylase [Mycobacterium pinniadriaticum]MCX2930827.1 uracil-DNA glycosylase [Mycobacterium pinniadriaticum]MCX2937251.1 uracil-DNA glycosylase [Mycobacterium pinniadriaticum]